MIHVYYGKGKGKTSAAIGLAIRAYGSDKKIYYGAFLKSLAAESGEFKILNKYLNVEIYQNQIHPIFDDYKKKNFEQLKKVIMIELDKVLISIKKKEFDVYILDELLNAENERLCTESQLKELLNTRRDIEIILTGRTCPNYIKDSADYVSEILEIKHPLQCGYVARKGIEY